MRENNRRSCSSPLLNDKDGPLRQAVEEEYKRLYRETHKAAQKTARHLLRNIQQPAAPRPLALPIPISTVDCDENKPAISVIVSDGMNRKLQTDSTPATVMPTLPIVRELISYVPTVKNVATRGNLIGIPYLGDQFDAEDQHLINSISIEPSKQTKLVRKKKLEDSSLDQLYQTLRSNENLAMFTNEQIVDEILHYHRDSTAKTRLLALANHSQCQSFEKPQSYPNIDLCETIDLDFEQFIIKPWCSKFCPRCFSYNCLLHKEGPSYLKLPEKISFPTQSRSDPCGSICYKHQRDPMKRNLSPTSEPAESDEIENVRKRPRRSSNSNEVLPVIDNQKKHLTSIENHSTETTISSPNSSPWTLTDRSFFRLFYFLCDGDLCLIKEFFDEHRTCQELYEQFVIDGKYFSQRYSLNDGSPFSIRRMYRRKMPDGTTRAFLNYMKKTLNRTRQTATTTTLKAAYQPCLHDGPCTAENKDCRCMQNGTFCEKYCNCAIDCPHRFPGCACKGSCLFNNCLCTAEGRECDADLCHNCGASIFNNQIETDEPMTKCDSSLRNVRSRTTSIAPSFRSTRLIENSSKNRRTNSRASLNSVSSQSNVPTISCANISLQRKIHKQILIAESDVAGYGAFLGSAIAQPGDLIAEYTGEIITEEEADRRGRLYDKRACSYLFNLDLQHCIDARQFGNKLRFANHSSKPNCVPKIKLVNGDYRIGIYAKEVIFQGDELFFEYMYDAHQLEQFVNNERVDETEQENLNVLKRYSDNFMLVQPWLD